jgi:hypothetical protein
VKGGSNGACSRQDGLAHHEEVSHVSEQLRLGHDALERLVWKLADATPSNTPEFWPDPAPTLEDVGRIYDLIDSVRSDALDLDGYVKRLERLLVNVNLMRLNFPIAEAAHAA